MRERRGGVHVGTSTVIHEIQAPLPRGEISAIQSPTSLVLVTHNAQMIYKLACLKVPNEGLV